MWEGSADSEVCLFIIGFYGGLFALRRNRHSEKQVAKGAWIDQFTCPALFPVACLIGVGVQVLLLNFAFPFSSEANNFSPILIIRALVIYTLANDGYQTMHGSLHRVPRTNDHLPTTKAKRHST